MFREKMKKIFPYLALVLATLVVGLPLLRGKMLDGDDAVFHLFRSYTTRAAISDGQLIPMINPYILGGFGYAYNMFYGILSSYGITLLSYLFKPFGLCVNIFILIVIFLSGLAMYQFVKDISKDKYIGLLGAFIYISSPYFLYDIYNRLALGEIVAFIFIPLLFYGIHSLIYDAKKKWYLLTIGTAGLFLSHTVSAFMIGIFAGLYLLINIKYLNKDIIKKIIFSLGLAFLLALPNILPLIEAKVSSEYMVFNAHYMKTTGVMMTNRSINLFQISRDELVIMTQVYVLLTVFIMIYSIWIKKKNKKIKSIYSYIVLCIFALLLTIKLVPWQFLPDILSTPQFPWRYLQAASFFLALLIPLIYQNICHKEIKKWLFIPISVCLIFSIAVTTTTIMNNEGINDNLLESTSIKKRGDIARGVGTASAEYLPKRAIYNYEYLVSHSKHPTILKGNSTIANVERHGSHLSFTSENSSSTIIELPYIYYPGYIIKDGQTSIASFETDNGLLGIELAPGKHHITAYYRGTITMIISYFVSLMTGLCLIIVHIKKSKCYN